MIPIRLAGNRTGRLLLGATAVAALVTACGGASTSSSSGGGGAAAGGPATISTTQASSGTVLTGPSGKTVYTLVDSSGAPVACSSACLAVWPPVTTTGTPQAGSGVTAMLSTASGSDGSTLAAANGDPLYYYSGDSSAGQVNGQGLTSFGGTWYAVQANGQKMSGKGSSGGTPAPDQTSGGGGYGY